MNKQRKKRIAAITGGMGSLLLVLALSAPVSAGQPSVTEAAAVAGAQDCPKVVQSVKTGDKTAATDSASKVADTAGNAAADTTARTAAVKAAKEAAAAAPSNCTQGNCVTPSCTTGDCASDNCCNAGCTASDCDASGCAGGKCYTGGCDTKNNAQSRNKNAAPASVKSVTDTAKQNSGSCKSTDPSALRKALNGLRSGSGCPAGNSQGYVIKGSSNCPASGSYSFSPQSGGSSCPFANGF